ncbi:MAG: tetratricopeptide repeat protein, partial [Flavobacteriales bacterium]|nr:tetratricopeptide repeat protein [Flavobacteriales bacterium]
MKWLEKWAVLLCSFFICDISLGQETEKEAKEFYNKGNYPKAIEIYTKLLEKDSMNYGRNYKTGVSYLRSNIDKTKAIRYFERAMLSYQRKPAVFYNLARAYHLNNQFDKAIEMYNMYNIEDAFGKKRVETQRLIESCYYARELIKLPRPVKFINLGPMVNSPFPDYHPHISKDGTILVYTSRRSGTPEANGIYPADVMVSQFVKEKFK